MEKGKNTLRMVIITEESTKTVDLMELEFMNGNHRWQFMKGILKMD